MSWVNLLPPCLSPIRLISDASSAIFVFNSLLLLHYFQLQAFLFISLILPEGLWCQKFLFYLLQFFFGFLFCHSPLCFQIIYAIIWFDAKNHLGGASHLGMLPIIEITIICKPKKSFSIFLLFLYDIKSFFKN